MRVLIVRNAYTYDFGGAERLAVGLAVELKKNNIDVLVASRQTRLLDYAKESNIPHLRSWWWSKQNWSGAKLFLLPVYCLWLTLLCAWYVYIVMRERPHVLHLMSKDDFIAGTIVGRLLGRRVIWTDCADLKFLYQNNDTWYKNPVGKLVYGLSKLAQTVVIVSYGEKALIEAKLNHAAPTNYKVIYSTISDIVVPPLKNIREPEEVIFCSTSRLVKAKGIQDLISAFTALSSKYKDCRLWIVGDGPDELIFRRSAEENNSILFWGHSDTPLRYLAAADVYVHPSHHEGFSLALAEAAMLGKPLIATDVGGNPEIVNKKNGILIEVRNVAALTEAMESLVLDKSLRSKLGKKARIDFINSFDLRKAVKDRYIALYEK